MAELVDAADLKSVDRKVVGVQVPPRALLSATFPVIKPDGDRTVRLAVLVGAFRFQSFVGVTF